MIYDIDIKTSIELLSDLLHNLSLMTNVNKIYNNSINILTSNDNKKYFKKMLLDNPYLYFTDFNIKTGLSKLQEKELTKNDSRNIYIIDLDNVEKIKESASFLEGIATMRQVSFGLLDMAFHSNDPSNIKSVKDFENHAFESTKLYPDVAENCMSVSFSHIFQGGYSSGYYSYKWAEVLDADAFAYFLECGIFNKEVATKFKENILSKGGTELPMELYKKFRGQEPKPDALLKRAGLI